MIILASSSPYRQALLKRLGKPFKTISPQVDESALPAETPEALAIRLAMSKAQAVSEHLALQTQPAGKSDKTLIIGSDQTATLDGRSIIGKPGTHERAVKQLRAASGRSMQFFTAVAILDPHTGKSVRECVATTVSFRTLTDTQIETYLRLETPYDCAGSAKSEGLGISLLASVSSSDPTALIGLPLIAVCEMLASLGHDVLSDCADAK